MQGIYKHLTMAKGIDAWYKLGTMEVHQVSLSKFTPFSVSKRLS